MWYRLIHMCPRISVTLLCAVFAFAPALSFADYQITVEPGATFEYGGISTVVDTPYRGNIQAPLATIHASQLSPNADTWTIDEIVPPFNQDVPSTRGIFLLERVDPATGFIDGGKAIRGQNYDVIPTSFTAYATTTHTLTFSMPRLGDPSTPSGRYVLRAIDLPEAKIINAYDPATDDWIQSRPPFTIEDLETYLAQGDLGDDIHFTEMLDSEPFVFDYVADGPPPCSLDCNDNVIFLPGVEGSRLYRPDYQGGTDKLWEPDTPLGNDVPNLFLSPDGTSIRSDVYAKEKDIIDTTPFGDIYKPFIQTMDALVSSKKINAWEPIAYDWRLSLDDILRNGNDINGRIYYSGDLAATTTPYIIQEVRRLAATSRTGKITIVAHSNGGLLAKRLTEVLGSDASKLIDKIIFVAVPQAGAPEAIAAGMHGTNQEIPFLVNKPTARTFASTSPMFYHLLPSNGYITQVDNPLITFDSTLPDWQAKFGSTIHSQETLDQFLTDSFGKVNSQTGDINQPVQMSQSLLSQANTLHDDLDAWTPPSGINLIQIAGWGIPDTITGVSYTKNKNGPGIEPASNFTIDGDGTVPVPSALWVSTTTGAEDYWVDLKGYNKDNISFDPLNIRKIGHAKILAIHPVDDFTADVITNTVKPLSSYTYLFNSAPISTGTRLRYSLHSPLTLNLYDDAGHHTGVSTTGEIEEQIPGTYYTEIGDVKYLFTDADTAGHIVMQGYAPGTFTLNVDQLQGDAPTASTAFTDIPTTPQTTVQMDVQSDISRLSPLSIDSNGDGTPDSFVASDGGVLSLDDLLTNLTTAVNNLQTKDKTKQQLLNKISTLQKKIDKQRQKQSTVLARLQAQVQKKATGGKIDADVAAQISSLLDDLIAQDATVPLDPTLIQQLTIQINAIGTKSLKNSLLAKVTRLQNLVGITRSLDTFTKTVTKKGSKGQMTDAEAQNILDILGEIQNVL